MVPKARSMTKSSTLSDVDNLDGDLSYFRTTDGYYYLSADAREKLPNYQYRGADHSLLYHYVLSPLAGWCVDHLVPTTVAPNSITLFGLVWMMTAYCIYWYHVPSLEILEDPPRWIFLWNGIAMLAYQTLDNMDGKQARRTKSSSPLGLLFDHGCDAINSIFGSANWIIGMALAPSTNLWQCWALIFGPFGMFYIATWEQYYTGELIMPIINGPNEGLLGGVLLSFTSYCLGPNFWQGVEWSEAIQTILPLPVVLRNCDFVVLAASIGFLQEIIIKTISVTRKYSGSAISLLPFMVLALCYFLIGYWQPNVWLSLPRTSLHLAMLLFVEMSTELMLAHVTAQPFMPRWHVLPLVALTIWVGSMRGATVDYWIVSYTWSLMAYLVFKIVLVIREICSTLQIWCFDIVTPYQQSDIHHRIRQDGINKNE